MAMDVSTTTIDKQIAALKSQGKSESTSKSLAKLVKAKSTMGGNATVYGNTGLSNPALSGTGSNSNPLSTGYSSGDLASNVNSYSSEVAKNLGIDPLQKAQQTALGNVTNIQGQLTALPNQVNTETRGFDVNEAQRGAIQQSRQAPLETQLGTATGNFNIANNALTTAQNTLSSMTSNYTDIMKTELDDLFRKEQLGQTLSGAEKDRQQTLAIAELNAKTSAFNATTSAAASKYAADKAAENKPSSEITPVKAPTSPTSPTLTQGVAGTWSVVK